MQDVCTVILMYRYDCFYFIIILLTKCKTLSTNFHVHFLAVTHTLYPSIDNNLRNCYFTILLLLWCQLNPCYKKRYFRRGHRPFQEVPVVVTIVVVIVHPPCLCIALLLHSKLGLYYTCSKLYWWCKPDSVASGQTFLPFDFCSVQTGQNKTQGKQRGRGTALSVCKQKVHVCVN